MTRGVPWRRRALGADAIGLNLVPGTPRELSVAEAAELARVVRTATAAAGRPGSSRSPRTPSTKELAAIVAGVDPDAVQLSGTSRSPRSGPSGRPVWKVLHLPAEAPPDVGAAAAEVVARGRA